MPWLPELVSIYPAKAREERGKTRREREASESMRKAALAADFSSRVPFEFSSRSLRIDPRLPLHAWKIFSAVFDPVRNISWDIRGYSLAYSGVEQPQERIRNPV